MSSCRIYWSCSLLGGIGWLEVEFGCNADGLFNRTMNRTLGSEYGKHAFDRFALGRLGAQVHSHMDAPENHYAILDFMLAHSVHAQVVCVRVNLAHPERPG